MLRIPCQTYYKWRKDKGEDMKHQELPLFHAENVPESIYDETKEHPTPEQLLVREATKALTLKQRRIWDMHNYDKLTQDAIAKKLHISQQTVQEHIKACERRITKWCKDNIGAYKLLKMEFGE